MKIIDLKAAETYKATFSETGEVKHASEALDDFYRLLEKDPQAIEGRPTKYWPLFNKCFGGLRNELIVLTAETGNGKSTFARNWFQDCFHQKIPACMFSLEEGILSTMHRFTQMEIGKKASQLTLDDKRAFGDALKQYPFYYVDRKGMISENFLLNTLHYAIDTHGIKFFMIDHLDYIAKQKHDWSTNESYIIGDCLRRLAAIAHEKGCTILLIVHPAKLSIQGGKRREVGIDELKGSSSIKQEADAVFSIFRESVGNQNTYLRFLKIRNHAFSQFQYTRIKFQFDKANLRLEELEFDGNLEEA